MGSVEDSDRIYPLKKPSGWQAPVPRWTLHLPDSVNQVCTLYIGVQCHCESRDTANSAEKHVREWLDGGANSPAVIDTFKVTHGFDIRDSRVWVAYWTDTATFLDRLKDLDLRRMWHSLGEGRDTVGLWAEDFVTPVDRLETNYARISHKPGAARLPGGEYLRHGLTGYWGAGRDRLPSSARDLYEPPDSATYPAADHIPTGIGEYLRGTNYDNMCHIRSGQWWTECDEAERAAYEQSLQPTLMSGMKYLWDHPQETGTIGLRFLQNLDDNGNPVRETCGAGFHRNWADLEKWSSRHPSHLAIFNGAIKHAKTFGEDRKFMTWHEVSILKEGEAVFEYVNCAPETGVIKWVKMDREPLRQ